jgi:serine/threonine protein phosphatase PrpC
VVTTGSILLAAAALALVAAACMAIKEARWRRKARAAAAPHGGAAKRSAPSVRPLQPLPSLHSIQEVDDWDVTQIRIGPLVEAPEAKDPSADFRHDDVEDDDDVIEPSRVIVIYEDDAEVDEATSPTARILVFAQADSDRGQKRTQNEDSFLAMPEQGVFAVADGMGGYAGGKVASNLAVDTLRSAFETGNFVGSAQSDKPVPRRGHELACALLHANQAVFAAARAEPTLSQMGTTAVVARFSANKQRLYLAHVGDSRCYRLRNGTLRQLTTDHTMSLLGMEGPRAKDLFRAIGVKPEVDVDLIVDKPRGDDVYLLCSDGLSKMVSDERIRELLLEESDLEAAVYGLIEAANDAGGRDNVTVLLVKVVEQARNVMPLPGRSAAKTSRAK